MAEHGSCIDVIVSHCIIRGLGRRGARIQYVPVIEDWVPACHYQKGFRGRAATSMAGHWPFDPGIMMEYLGLFPIWDHFEYLG